MSKKIGFWADLFVFNGFGIKVGKGYIICYIFSRKKSQQKKQIKDNKRLHLQKVANKSLPQPSNPSNSRVTLRGSTVVDGANTFTSGTGDVNLNGNTAIGASKTFTVGTSGSGGATTIYGQVTVGGSGGDNGEFWAR